MALRNPIPFGRYLLLERVNVGGMAEVFRAKSFGVEGFERLCAVKRILPQMAEDQEFVKMFIDEARIASQLSHQSIVQIHELGREADVYFISMEYVAGRDLRVLLDRFKRKRQLMSEGLACHLISRVCEALDYAHRKKDPSGNPYKIIHRDVSPQNVIVSFEGEVKLCDFGIAKAVTQSTRTQAGVLKGKFAYMSPEQVQGKTLDHRSDLFALGGIFYEMLTGERLFLGESDFSTLEAVRAARIPNPKKYNRNLPRRLQEILMRCLQKSPDRRYQWASEVYADLHEYLATTGKFYHAHHLREFMQTAYGREIKTENRKLEEFMRLKRPPRPRPGDHADPGLSPAVASLRAAPAEIDTDSALVDPYSEASGADESSQVQTSAGNGSMLPDVSLGDENATLMLDEESVEGMDSGSAASSAKVTQAGPGSDASPRPRPRGMSADVQRELLARLDAESVDGDENATIDAVAREDIDHEPSIVDMDDGPNTVVSGEAEAPFAPLFEENATNNETLMAPDEFPSMVTSEIEEDMTTEASAGVMLGLQDEGGIVPRRQSSNALGSKGSVPGGRREIREVSRRQAASAAAFGSEETAPQNDEHSGPLAIPRGGESHPWAADIEPEAIDQRPRSLSDPRVQIALASVVGLIAVALLVLFVGGRSTKATLQIQTEPTTDVLVRLDGQIVSQSTPVTLEDLEVGPHVVELRAKGFETYRQAFEIAEPRPHTLTIPLEASSKAPPAPPKLWSLEVKSRPKGAAVTIDGKLAGKTPVVHQGLVLGHAPVVTVELAGFAPFREEVASPEAEGDVQRLTAKLTRLRRRSGRPANRNAGAAASVKRPQPKSDQVKASSPQRPDPAPAPPKAEKSRGTERASASAAPVKSRPKPAGGADREARKRPSVDGDKPSRPRVDPKNDRRAARTKAPAKPSKPRANKKARREAATNQGFLMITTSPTGIPVVIDGKPTGLKTPVRRPHPLAPGTHVVRLVGRSGRPTDYSVKITPGSTTKLVKRVP